ncbi:MAG: non-ribosomal peptide synthetase [Acidimicrobiia bacterium]
MSATAPLLDRPAASFADNLDAHGDRRAIIHRGMHISYEELAARVRDTAARLGTGRKLVLIAAANDPEPVVTYLAALHARHPVLLVPDGNRSHLRSLVRTYDPDVVLSGTGAGWELSIRRPASPHRLHPDLALLLTTSGSTGASKLVRLSHRNLQANAESIAQYLDIRESDRAVTSLPMAYCYGLSVINSHLLRGAGLILTSNSVVDPCFWDSFRAHGGTSFAGVTHTFELLDRIGFDEMRLPGLRYVTQAGGKLAPDRVRRYAQLAERDGWRFYVMYGQTEATARMAYLPPELARRHPGAIGIPVPGGSFTIEPLDGPAGNGDGQVEGELVYRGPNVMLGYAERVSDLAAGATIDALRTGDIARRTSDGLYEIVGRRSRFLKLFGLRIDLDRVERLLDEHGVPSMCTGDDRELIVGIEHGHGTERVRRLIAQHIGLPRAQVRVCELAELPRLANGKPDYVVVAQLAREAEAGAVEAGAVQAGAEAGVRAGTAVSDRSPVHAVLAEVLGRPDIEDDDTFVSLGGDSLSYVETSIRLERALGHLPPDWHVTPVRDLAARRRPRSRVVTRVETNVVLRALAIVFVVGTHAGLFYLPGGAHLLLGIAGFNFARFQLGAGHIARSTARIAIPSMCVIGIVAAARDDFGLVHALLVNGQLGGAGTPWRFWFVEALVQILVVLGVVLAVPAVRRTERRHAYGFALALLAAGLAVRFDLLGLPELERSIFRPHEIFWLFAAGWVAARASTPRQRVLLSALVVAAVPGYFEQPERNMLVAAGLLALTWVPTVALVRPVNRLLGVVAGASLYIYLTHSDVYPLLLAHGPLPAVAVALAAGIVTWSVVQRVTAWVEARVRW